MEVVPCLGVIGVGSWSESAAPLRLAVAFLIGDQSFQPLDLSPHGLGNCLGRLVGSLQHVAFGFENRDSVSERAEVVIALDSTRSGLVLVQLVDYS